MAKFRRSNVRNGRRSSKAWVPRMVMVVIVCIFLMVFLVKEGAQFLDYSKSNYEIAQNEEPRYYLPSNSTGQLVDHKHFSLSYNNVLELAEWVAYELKAEEIMELNPVPATRYLPDSLVIDKTAYYEDYSNSGYVRGHMVPIADLLFDSVALRSSFLMSNIVPQLPQFNQRIWKRLEEHVRVWTQEKDRLVIITGPVFKEGEIKTIGRNNVAVPDAFFKTLLNSNTDSLESISFLIPHQEMDLKLEDFIVSIDSIEKVTQLNFFGDLLNEEEEALIESKMNFGIWDFSHPTNQIRFKTPE